MSEKSLALFLLFLVLIIFIGNNLAIVNTWYFKYKWLDLPIHFLGGLFVGLLALYLYFYKDIMGAVKHNSAFAIIVIGVLTVSFTGILWEFFEYLLDYIRIAPIFFQFDSKDIMGDLLFDILGGAAAGLTYLFLWRRAN